MTASSRLKSDPPSIPADMPTFPIDLELAPETLSLALEAGFGVLRVPLGLVRAHAAACQGLLDEPSKHPADRIAELGGLTPFELGAVLSDQSWSEFVSARRPWDTPEGYARLYREICAQISDWLT